MIGLLAATTAVTLTFVSHAAFFSTRTNEAAALDPQVFVKDAAAPAGLGPQDIQHDVGLRPALISDPPESDLFSAQAAPLGLTLNQWFSAAGTVDIVPLNANAENVIVHFQGLSPHGVYSLFENRDDQQTTVYTPLDGVGTSNSFVADAGGSGSMTFLVTPPLTRGNAIVLVFHSDGSPHGMSRGGVGLDAHDQLIVRLP
jgi:hypothetical protein